MPNCYLYSRVSTVRQVDGLGLSRQAQERDKWLQAHSSLNLTVVQNYSDLGLSARGKAQTEGKLSLILENIESGKIPLGSYLIVDNLDRLSREELIDAYYMVLGIIRKGIIIVTVSDGIIYDRTEREKTMFQLLISLVILARSSDESDNKSDTGLKNWRMKREYIGKTEKPYTTNTPAWISYDKDKNIFILNNHAATVIRIYELAASGLGNPLIVQTLIKEKYTPIASARRKDGGKWSTQYVKMILNNRAVLGEFQAGVKNHGTDEKRQLIGEPVFDYFPKVSENIQNLYDKVRIIRNERAEKMSKHRNRRGDFTNLFSGLCRCAGCNGVMTVVNRPDRKNLSYLRCSARYVTKTCKDGNMYNYPRMEKTILDQLENVIFPNNAEEIDDSELIAAKDKIIDLKNRINNLLDEAETMGFSMVSDRIAQRKSELETIEREISILENKRLSSTNALSPDEYIQKIKLKRLDIASVDIDVRKNARAEMKLLLARLIKKVEFRKDKSMMVFFAIGQDYNMEITADGAVTLGAAAGSGVVRWRNPSGGMETAKRL